MTSLDATESSSYKHSTSANVPIWMIKEKEIEFSQGSLLKFPPNYGNVENDSAITP